jgi:hypothetical protein
MTTPTKPQHPEPPTPQDYAQQLDTVYPALAEAIHTAGPDAELLLATLSLSLLSERLQNGHSAADCQAVIEKALRLSTQTQN